MSGFWIPSSWRTLLLPLRRGGFAGLSHPSFLNWVFYWMNHSRTNSKYGRYIETLCPLSLFPSFLAPFLPPSLSPSPLASMVLASLTDQSTIGVLPRELARLASEANSTAKGPAANGETASQACFPEVNPTALTRILAVVLALVPAIQPFIVKHSHESPNPGTEL